MLGNNFQSAWEVIEVMLGVPNSDLQSLANLLMHSPGCNEMYKATGQVLGSGTLLLEMKLVLLTVALLG